MINMPCDITKAHSKEAIYVNHGAIFLPCALEMARQRGRLCHVHLRWHKAKGPGFAVCRVMRVHGKVVVTIDQQSASLYLPWVILAHGKSFAMCSKKVQQQRWLCWPAFDVSSSLCVAHAKPLRCARGTRQSL